MRVSVPVRRRRFLNRFAGAVLAGIAGPALLAACDGGKKLSFQGVDVTGAEFARGFSLRDTEGTVRTLADFRGKAVVVFFGYTQCPDVCPTTLSEIVEVRRQLGADGVRVQAVFVTVDPARDTAPVLRAYMQNFDPSFVALVPTPEELAVVAKEFRIFYRKADGKTPTSYTMDHSAGAYVFDPQGRVRVFTTYGKGAQPLLEDVRTLLREAG